MQLQHLTIDPKDTDHVKFSSNFLFVCLWARDMDASRTKIRMQHLEQVKRKVVTLLFTAACWPVVQDA